MASHRKNEKDIALTGLSLTMNATTATGAVHDSSHGVVANTLTLGGNTYTGTLTLAERNSNSTNPSASGTISIDYYTLEALAERVKSEIRCAGAHMWDEKNIL